jgi:hypothetical protein
MGLIGPTRTSQAATNRPPMRSSCSELIDLRSHGCCTAGEAWDRLTILVGSGQPVRLARPVTLSVSKINRAFGCTAVSRAATNGYPPPGGDHPIRRNATARPTRDSWCFLEYSTPRTLVRCRGAAPLAKRRSITTRPTSGRTPARFTAAISAVSSSGWTQQQGTSPWRHCLTSDHRRGRGDFLSSSSPVQSFASLSFTNTS